MKQKATDVSSLVFRFLEGLGEFQYRLSGYDKLWEIIFPDAQGRFHWVRVIQYRETRYLFHVDGKSSPIEVSPEGAISLSDSPAFFGGAGIFKGDLEALWQPLFEGMVRWFGRVKKGWIQAAREIQENYPLERRIGYVSNSLVRASLVDLYRLDKEMGEKACETFVALVEEGYFNRDDQRTVTTMSAGDFFNYCRIAYIAGKRPDDRVDKKLAGRQMYKQFADGRHDGLLDIDESSPEEFADWIGGSHAKRGTGGHPWEIKRGGNTTHIDMYVTRPPYQKEGFLVNLSAPALNRLAEALRMFLAIHREGLPIGFDDADGVRKRLLGQDNIGIIPEYQSFHRANQLFEKSKDVFETLHLADLGRYKQRLTRFITWDPLPLLVPRGNPESQK